MEDLMIINNETAETLIRLLMENCTFMIKDKRSVYHDDHYIKHIIVSFDNIEYELFPEINVSDEKSGGIIIEHLKKLLNERSLIDIQSSLKNNNDKTKYYSFKRDHGEIVPPSNTYSFEVDNYLERVIMKAELKNLTTNV